jgi:hypothetical protein
MHANSKVTAKPMGLWSALDEALARRGQRPPESIRGVACEVVHAPAQLLPSVPLWVAESLGLQVVRFQGEPALGLAEPIRWTCGDRSVVLDAEVRGERVCAGRLLWEALQ